MRQPTNSLASLSFMHLLLLSYCYPALSHGLLQLGESPLASCAHGFLFTVSVTCALILERVWLLIKGYLSPKDTWN
jgi:hypothetical protein